MAKAFNDKTLIPWDALKKGAVIYFATYLEGDTEKDGYGTGRCSVGTYTLLADVGSRDYGVECEVQYEGREEHEETVSRVIPTDHLRRCGRTPYEAIVQEGRRWRESEERVKRELVEVGLVIARIGDAAKRAEGEALNASV